MEEGDHFTITATKQNHFRYEYEVPVIPGSGPHAVAEKNSSFALYPNPTDGEVRLILKQDLTGKVDFDVYDMTGKCLTNKTFQDLKEGQSIAIDLQHYAPGLYVVKLRNDEGNWREELIVR